MNAFRNIVSLFLVMLMLTTTIGIGIYKHTCLVTGHQGMSLFVVADSGSDAGSSCCSKKQDTCTKTISAQSNKSCCQQTADYYQLDTPLKTEDHYTYQAPALPVFGLLQLPALAIDFDPIVSLLPIQHNLPPPPQASRQLAQLQTYLI